MDKEWAFMAQIIIIYTVLLIAFLCIVVFFTVKYVHKINNKFRDGLAKQNVKDFSDFKTSVEDLNNKLLQEVIAVISNSDPMAGMSKEEKYQQHQKELLFTFSKLRKIIGDNLYKTMNATKSCRVALYLLHNGQQSISGVSFAKISCVGEKVLIGSGIREKILNHSNMPINIFDSMFDVLNNNGRYIVMNDSETMQTARSQFISSSKIYYSQLIAIYDSSNNILGFVLAEFDHNYNKQNADNEYEILKSLSNEIAPILSFSEYAKLTMQVTIDSAIDPA